MRRVAKMRISRTAAVWLGTPIHKSPARPAGHTLCRIQIQIHTFCTISMPTCLQHCMCNECLAVGIRTSRIDSDDYELVTNQ